MLGAASLRNTPDWANRSFPTRRISAAARCAEPSSAGGADREIAFRVLERLELEIIVLDATGAIVFCNVAARRLLEAKEGVYSHCGALRFTDCENNRWLQSQLTFVPPAEGGNRTAFILDEDRSKHRTVSLDVLGGGPATTSCFVLTFSRLTSSLAEEGAQRLMRHFGLTPAEQRLALFLNGGGRLSGAARTFGLSRHTVSNQLRSIFDKIGVRRQSELTRMMCGGPQMRALT